MEHLLIRRPFGSPAIGDTAEETGSGSLAIGRDPQDLTQFGSLGTGNREEKVGSGTQDIGNTIKNDRFGVKSSASAAKFK